MNSLKHSVDNLCMNMNSKFSYDTRDEIFYQARIGRDSSIRYVITQLLIYGKYDRGPEAISSFF